ncbi:NAD(P)H-binding protein [Thermoleophilia bacterium SCSIO 60948]|nr:NAD(P)H-binding protein [Thermoleophilia bacterium SCSIO 60948]
MTGRVLIAGATGYIGGLLAHRLAGEGKRPVRCMARDRSKATGLERAGCEVVEADVLDPDSLGPALEGVEVAYYLVHSMGRGAEDDDFAERDRRGADNFGAAAKAAGVSQIVYMGGLGDTSESKHLQSREETAERLQASGIPVTYFRAAAVIGAGSESFRTVLYLVKRLPAMVTPKWTQTRTQPIGVADVIDYLARAPEIDEAKGREVQIGGPEVTTYGGMMDDLAEAMGKRKPLKVTVPLLSPTLSSHWIGLVTPVDADVAKPLVQGLTTETVVKDPEPMKLFGVTPTPLDRAMRDALSEDQPA